MKLAHYAFLLAISFLFTLCLHAEEKAPQPAASQLEQTVKPDNTPAEKKATKKSAPKKDEKDEEKTEGIPQKISILYEETNYIPWSTVTGKGVDIEMIEAILSEMKIELELKSLPWKECLEMLQENKVDAALNGSYKESRAKYCKYPLNAIGEPDSSLALHQDGYSLYKVSGSKVEWDGKGIVDSKSETVGAVEGVSVIDILKKSGCKVIEMDSPEALLEQLLLGKIEAVALPTITTDIMIMNTPKYNQKIVKSAQAISKKPYFLIFSLKFAEEYPELCKKIWNAIAEYKKTPDYQKLLETYSK